MLDMAVTFEAAAKNVWESRTPEELFGVDEALAKSAYHVLARALHPDHNSGSAESTAAFARLQAQWDAAERRMAYGAYGKYAANTFPITGKRRTYIIGEKIARGDIADVYQGFEDNGSFDADGDVIAKIVRAPRNNDLIKHEFRTITTLHKKSQNPLYFPDPGELVAVRTGGGVVRNVGIYGAAHGFVTLADVIRGYPDGVPPRDAAWIWRRILTALGQAHDLDLIHGAVFADHILIHPVMHGVILIDWTASVPDGSHLPLRFKDRAYPPEVSMGERVGPGADIYMAGMVMVDLLWGDKKTSVSHVPRPIRAHLQATLSTHPKTRSTDAFALRESFDEIIEELWGPRKYREFPWPPGDPGTK